MATIKEVKEQLATLTDLDDHRWASFEEDSRAGVQTAIKQRRKAIQAEIAEEERLEMMLSYENRFMLRELNSLQVLMKLDVVLWLGQW